MDISLGFANILGSYSQDMGSNLLNFNLLTDELVCLLCLHSKPLTGNSLGVVFLNISLYLGSCFSVEGGWPCPMAILVRHATVEGVVKEMLRLTVPSQAMASRVVVFIYSI